MFYWTTGNPWPIMPIMPTNRYGRTAALGLAVTAVTVVVYAGSFDGPFIYDDIDSIVRNRYTRSLWPLTAAMASPGARIFTSIWTARVINGSRSPAHRSTTAASAFCHA